MNGGGASKNKSRDLVSILKTNKNNQKVFVRNFVLFMGWKAWNIDPNYCLSYIYSTPAGRDTHMAEFTG